MRRPESALYVGLALTFLALSNPAAANVDCSDTDKALEYWRPVRQQAAGNGLPADELAPELVSCLGSPDPELRDRIAYELFTYWLRQEQLSDATRRGLLETLSAKLGGRDTLTRSFSALILAEIMRSDAVKQFMSAAERQTLLERAAAALANETDFRGLDPHVGWVHPVAHLADLLWRFALHPATTTDQAEMLLKAVRSKTSPTDTAYAFNEGDRLARVVSTLIAKATLDPATIGDWLGGFQNPVSMEKWSDAFASPGGMAELHNTKQFLRALSDQLSGSEIDPAISEPLEALVAGFTQLI
jgi:hypothetical protein